MSITTINPLLGAHMSIAGGVKNALIAGESLGCTAIQIFTASNRQWSFNPIKEQDVLDYLTHKKTSPISFVMSHASYLINLGSPDAANAQKSQQALEAELYRCNQLALPWTVLHPGAYINSSEESCLNRIADHINTVLEKSKGECGILLENTAGQGTTVGHTFEQLATILAQIHHKKRVGICFDTCHALVAGYNFSTKDAYQTLWNHFNAVVGLKNLKAIHMNDSKKGLGSHIDRHEHIGEGALGIEPFKCIMNDDALIHIPKILETPKDETLKDDIRNLAILRQLIQ